MTETELACLTSSGNTKPSEGKPKLRGTKFHIVENQSKENALELVRMFKELKSCDYGIIGEGVAETGHNHWHIFVHFNQQYRMKKDFFKFNSHIELCKKSSEHNINYVRNQENGVIDEWGNKPIEAKYKTIGELKSCNNPDELDWKQYNTWLRVKSQPEPIKLANWHKDVKVYFITGPSGIGKSCKAREIAIEHGYEEADEISYDGHFWIGATEDRECAIYDDFRPDHMKPNEFIKFIDYNIHTINVKHGFIQNKYKLIIFTSIAHPEYMYNVGNEPKKQWMRRIEIIELEE